MRTPLLMIPDRAGSLLESLSVRLGSRSYSVFILVYFILFFRQITRL